MASDSTNVVVVNEIVNSFDAEVEPFEFVEF